MAEGRSFEIKRDRDIIGGESFKLACKHIYKAEDGIRRKAVLRGEKSYSVKLTVQDAVTVDTKQFFHKKHQNPFKVLYMEIIPYKISICQ